MTLRRAIAVTVALAIVTQILTGCVASTKPATGLVASVVGSSKPPKLSAPVLTQQQVDSLTEISPSLDYLVGAPVEISFGGGIPSQGVTLTRAYAAPLPDPATATFIFFDPESGAWTAVPSTLSSDRRTLHATVHHLSLWDDIVAGSSAAVLSVKSAAKSAGQTISTVKSALQGTAATVTKTVGAAVQQGGDALYWGSGKLFGTRVEQPECTTPTPGWIDAQTDFDLQHNDDPNNAIRFCIGTDPNDKSTLVVKARVNRSFAFPYELGVTPSTVENSSFAPSLSAALAGVGDLDRTMAQSIAQFGASQIVMGGQEIDLTIPTNAVRGFDDVKPVLHFSMPNTALTLVSAIYQALVGAGLDKTTSAGSALVSIAACASSMGSAMNGEPGAVAPAVLNCLSAGKAGTEAALEVIAEKTGTASIESAAKYSKALLSKVTLAIALAPAAVDVLDFIAEKSISDSLREVILHIIKSKLADPQVAGFPSQIQGEWCRRGDSSSCFSLAEIRQTYPSAFLSDSGPDELVPGVTAYAICLEHDLPGTNECTMAASKVIAYFPAGVGWNCVAVMVRNWGLPACNPDYSAEHDASKPRIVIEPNHQQDSDYHDAPPYYRIEGT